jgi:hypothetical protein
VLPSSPDRVFWNPAIGNNRILRMRGEENFPCDNEILFLFSSEIMIINMLLCKKIHGCHIFDRYAFSGCTDSIPSSDSSPLRKREGK